MSCGENLKSCHAAKVVGSKEPPKAANVVNSSFSISQKLKFALENGALEGKILIRAEVVEKTFLCVIKHVEELFKELLEESDTATMTSQRSIVLKTKSIQTAEKLAVLTHIGDVPVTISIIEEGLTTKYIVKNVPVEFSLCSILQELQQSGILVSQVIRFTKKGSADLLPVILIKELGQTNRNDIVLLNRRYPTAIYIENPKICYRCLHFGHFQYTCRGQRRCHTCSGVHSERISCSNRIYCFRCKSETHTATDPVCEFVQREKWILNKVRTEGKSLAEASAEFDKEKTQSYAKVMQNSTEELAKYREGVKSLKEDLNCIKNDINFFNELLTTQYDQLLKCLQDLARVSEENTRQIDNINQRVANVEERVERIEQEEISVNSRYAKEIFKDTRGY